jgi:hypothetical protein
MIAPTQPCVVREECQKAEWQHGFRRVVGESDGWAVVESTTAQGTIWPAAESAQCLWIPELDNPGVAAELAVSFPDNPGSGIARHSFSTLTTLNAVLPCVYQLAASPETHRSGLSTSEPPSFSRRPKPCVSRFSAMVRTFSAAG